MDGRDESKSAMPGRVRPIRIATTLALTLFWGPASAAPTTLALQDCRLESPISSGSASARCGWLEVAEDPDAREGGKVRLHVAVIPALRLQAAPDPLFVLTGGPGQAASDFYLSAGPAFARIRRARDIVVVDQRGTGKSNRFDCDFPEDADVTVAHPKALQDHARQCIAGLPGDPRFYTTSVAVRDLDDVRAALGYETVNLYGVSYGTRVAQHYMRRYPQRVRAVVLDGAVPADVALGPDVAIDAQRALDSIFARCGKDAACASAFPDLPAQFTALRAQLQQQAQPLVLPDPIDAGRTSVNFGAIHMSAAVRLLTYSDETASVLPLLIHEAYTRKHPESLAAQYLMVRRSTEDQIAYGMHFAVVCSEDVPRLSQERVTAQQLAQTYLGRSFVEGISSVCEVWPRGSVDDDFGVALKSSIPTLILSGSDDPVTPARYGERVLQGLERGRHLVLEGQGHGQLGVGCMPRLIAGFIGSGSTQFDATCLDDVTPTPFMLSRSGPAP